MRMDQHNYLGEGWGDNLAMDSPFFIFCGQNIPAVYFQYFVYLDGFGEPSSTPHDFLSSGEAAVNFEDPSLPEQHPHPQLLWKVQPNR